MGGASGVSDTPQRNRNNIPNLLRAMSVKGYVKDGNICTTIIIIAVPIVEGRSEFEKAE